ncbi:MAG: HAMP domain-containing histidine kinase [Lewinellaceae bacterium]|nr:HAMP domain-containing histidine kinase [Lewinellaceae bacterium]
MEPAVDEKLKPKISLIRRNGQNLLRLINQILDLVKLESHTLKINYVQGDILPYLRYISESLHSVANARNVMLRVESNEAPSSWTTTRSACCGSCTTCCRTPLNIRRPAGGYLRVTVVAAHGAPTAVITVADNGAGIPPEDLPHIFGRFLPGQKPEK